MKPILLLCSVLISFQSFAQSNFKADIAAFRTNYKSDFTLHESSPFYSHQEALSELHFFSPKKKYKVKATVKKITGEEQVIIKTYAGTEKKFQKYAWAHFEIKGKSYKLMLYRNIKNMAIPKYRDLLFLPFKDISNGTQTYGGGRYIDIDLKNIKDDQLTIDFNKCYNPYCAFSDGYFCPVPPVENHLPIKIPVGEKMYQGPKLKRPK